MLLLRKIDCYGQLLLVCGIILSCLVLFSERGCPPGLFSLGCWQLLSAIINSYSFAKSGFTRRIFLYWTVCLTDVVLFSVSYWLISFTGRGVAEILFVTSLTGAFAVAAYYWWIYYKLIGFIFLRNELDGLTKSKH
jgi:hypothetical protein